MYRVVGIESAIIYATGSRMECLQLLNKRFPSYKEKISNLKVSKKL